MAKFKKGESGNSRGRPKGSLNKDNPQKKLQQALSNGYDIKKLKQLIIDYITDEKTKMSSKDIKDLLKIAYDNEIKLLNMSLKEEGKNKSSDDDDDFEDYGEDDEVPEVRLKAQ